MNGRKLLSDLWHVRRVRMVAWRLGILRRLKPGLGLVARSSHFNRLR